MAEAPHQRLQDLEDALLEPLVEHQLALGETSDDLDRHVVGGGAESAARDHEVDLLGGHEAQLRLDVLRPVPTDGDVGQLDPLLEQPVRQPGAVAVLYPAREHLGAGDDDARACRHQVRRRAARPTGSAGRRGR